MKISCQSCGAKYNIADEKVRGKIVKIACKKCGARIEIDGREQAADQSHGDQDETRVYDQPPPGASPGGAEMWTCSVDDNDQREVNTDQLVELYRAGTINADTFVWRDGMADWQPIRDVEMLRDPIAHASSGATSVPPIELASEPAGPAASSPAYPSSPPNGNGAAAPLVAAAAGYGTPQVDSAAQQAARLGGGPRRGAAVDLFAPNAAGAEDEDVATSAPQGAALTAPMGGGVGGAVQESGKPLGARNENSVLFSLAALTASGPSNSPAVVPGDDEKSGLIDIQKLAAAAKPGGENRAKLDDIMNLGGGGAFGALGAPILAPPPAAALEAPPEQKRGQGPMLYVLIALVVGVLGLGLVLILVLTKKDDTSATTKKKDDDSKGLQTPSNDGTTNGATTTAPGPDTVGTPHPVDTSPTMGASTDGTSTAGTKPTTTSTKPVAIGTSTTTAKPTTTATDAPTKPTTNPGSKCTSLDCQMGLGTTAPPATTTPPAGGPEFNKDAARASLSSIGYKDCAGSGSGSVVVTFAPSGGVAGASVSGDLGGANGCIQGRFMKAHVPAFSGPPKSVGWKVSL